MKLTSSGGMNLSNMKKVLLLISMSIIIFVLVLNQLIEHGIIDISMYSISYEAFSIFSFKKSREVAIDYRKEKHILFVCDNACGGWGDRLKGIMSAYTFSLIMKRHFSIYINNPCHITHLLSPNEINWNSKLVPNGQNLSILNSFNKTEHNFIGPFVFGYIAELRNKPRSHFESNDSVIVIKVNQIFQDSLSLNLNIQDKISDVGYSPNNFTFQTTFKTWYRKMFKMTPLLQAKHDFFLNLSRTTPNTKIICAQIRLGINKKLNDFFFNHINESKRFWEFIKKNLITNLTDYKIFITSDTEEVINDAFVEFGSERMIFIPGLITHIDQVKHTNMEKNDCSKAEKTILDFEFIKNCDSYIICQSGFGKLSALNRNNPDENLYIFYNNRGFIKINDTTKPFPYWNWG